MSTPSLRNTNTNPTTNTTPHTHTHTHPSNPITIQSSCASDTEDSRMDVESHSGGEEQVIHIDMTSAPNTPSYHSFGALPTSPLAMDDTERRELEEASDIRINKLCASKVEGRQLNLAPQATKAFYEQQNAMIEQLIQIEQIHRCESIGHSVEDDGADNRAVQWAIRASFVCTLFLICLKCFGAYWSSSMAVIATAVDSSLDLLSQGAMLVTNRAMHKHEPYRYPLGKTRLEPLGLIIFAVVMAIAAVLLLAESARSLQEGLKHTPVINMDAITITIICVSIVVQLCFFVYCRRVARATHSSSADALASDHINDVMINIIGGVPAVIAGYASSHAWWLDPCGAIGLSIYIGIRWFQVSSEQLNILVGLSAPREFLCSIIYLAMIQPQVQQVDTVLAYHVGIRYQVECDVVLPADMPLRKTHDIGESLQLKIESIGDVETCFVHLDYESSHSVTSEHKMRYAKSNS